MSWVLPGRKSIETGQVSLQLTDELTRNRIMRKYFSETSANP